MGTAVLEPPARQIQAEEAEREQGRARKAVEAVAADLMARGNLAGGEAQAVLEAQAMMAQDRVDDGRGAPYLCGQRCRACGVRRVRRVSRAAGRRR
ncbi:phosphoenolpyruvate-utilizing N-terminal domain-containing protein [Streptomyces sp. INA 01156]